MTTEAIIQKVHRILIEEFELDESNLNGKADLYADLGLDSLDSVDLVVAMEKEFGFKFNRAMDEGRIRETRALQEVYAFVADKIGAGPRGT